MTGHNSYLEYKRDTRHLLYWMLHAYNKIIESSSLPIRQPDDLYSSANTTGQIKISALVPIAKLIAKHINPIPATVYRLFKSTIAARIATHDVFQQIVFTKPDPEIEKSNASHKHFIDTLTEAFEAMGGEEWASKRGTETQRNGSGKEGTSNGDNYDDIFSNKFSLLNLDGDSEEVEDALEEEPHPSPVNNAPKRPRAKPTRKGKKGKRGKKSGGKSKSKQPSLDDVPLERYCFTEEVNGAITEYLMAVFSLVKQWMELRHYIQELWREVAYGDLNSAVASALSHMGVSMIKTAESAIFADFPGFDFYEIIMLTATRGDPEEAQGMFRNTFRCTGEDGTEELKEISIDIKEQFLVNGYIDLLDFAMDFQKTRSGKPTKPMMAQIRDWDPHFDLQTATKEQRLKWRRAYTINWLYDLVNVFSCIVVQRNTMRGQNITLEDVDWSVNGPWDHHQRIFGLSEFAGDITSFAMKKPGTNIQPKILPHHVFQLQILVDSMMTSRGWMIHNIKGHILEPPATNFRPGRDIDLFLDRRNERVGQGYCYAVENLVHLLEEDAMLHGNPRRHQRQCIVLRGLRDGFLYWLGESKHKYGLATIPPSRFTNSDSNGLWEYSPFLCGAGLMEALELTYSSSLMMWDRIPEPMCVMHLHNMLLKKGYLKEEVTLYSTLQMLFQRTFFLDGEPPTSKFCKAYLAVYWKDGSRCPTFKRRFSQRKKLEGKGLGIHAMLNLSQNLTFRQKSLLTIFREANWIPERIPDEQLPLATTLGLLRMGQVKPTIDPATGKKVLKETPLINRARSEGVIDEAIIHMAGVLDERNTDMARIQAKKRARYFERNPSGLSYIPPPPRPVESDDPTINIIPGGSEMLRVLKWDFISDVCGKLRPLSSINYVSMTVQFMTFFKRVEAELKRRRNPTWLRAYEEESMFMQEKRVSITMLVLDEEDDECMRVMAEVFKETPVGFMNHIYWDGLESHEHMVNKLENKGPEFDRTGPPCMVQ